MLDLALERRRSTDRCRASTTRWVSRLEALEDRVVLNGAVGVPAQFSPPLHLFQITSIPEDADNDGRVTSQSVTIIGFAERPDRGDFSDTHLQITIQALENGTPVGSVNFGTPNFRQDPNAPNRALFQIPVTLQSATPAPQAVTFRITVDPFGSLDVVRMDNPSQPLTATFVVEIQDVTGPTVDQIGPITTPRQVPVQTLDVTFSEAIDPASFTRDDLALTRDGAAVDLAAVTITQVNPTTSRLAGLEAATTTTGDYVLTVNATGVRDLAGNSGVASPRQSINFTVLPGGGDVTGPTIVGIAPITSPRVEPVPTVDVTFSEPLGAGTFTAADLALTRDGQAVTLGAEVMITPLDASGTVFRVAGLEMATTAPGAYVLLVNATGVEDAAGNPGTGSQEARFTVLPPPVTGPKLVSVLRFGIRREPTVLVLTFDRELDATRAEDLANYRILRTGRPRPVGAINDVVVPIGHATYDGPTRTVTLVPLRRLPLHEPHVLVVEGSGEGGITDTSGGLLDGDADGQIGGDAVTILDPQNYAGSAYNNRPSRSRRQLDTSNRSPSESRPEVRGRVDAARSRRQLTPAPVDLGPGSIPVGPRRLMSRR